MAGAPPDSQIAGKFLSLYDGIYKEADPYLKGSIKAQAAASFLKRSNLSNAILGQIWELSDRPPKGYLDKHGMFIALKLVACAQQGLILDLSNLTADISPPIISAQAQSPSLPAFGDMANVYAEWSIKQKDVEKYEDIFRTLGPVDGKLSGDQVKPVLLNSNLPADVLGKIWFLADIDQDGMLDREEMCVALHLVYRALENDPVPAALPPSMVPPSKRKGSQASLASLSRKNTLTSGVMVLPALQSSTIPRRSRTSSVTSMESIGMPGFGTQSPAGSRSLSGTPVPVTMLKPPAPWIVDKYKWEQAFNDADTDRDGLVNGNDVKLLFLKSGLAQMYLAHIWALCDIGSSGMLNLEQFALAMFFVDQKRVYNIEPPAELPPDLIPPSFRPNPAGMTDMATNTSQHECAIAESMGVVGAPQSSLPRNKEIDQVMQEVFEIQKERREFEQQTIQLEADTTIKQSEIRNLEVELATLEATLTQLEKQKREAQKRLDDLENQRLSLNSTVNDIRLKNEDDQTALSNLKAEIETASFTMKAQHEELTSKQADVQQVAEEERQLEMAVRKEQENLKTLIQEDLQIEEYVQKSNSIVNQLREQRHYLIEKLAQLEEAVGSDDLSILDRNPNLMMANDEQQLNRILGSKPETSNNFQQPTPMQPHQRKRSSIPNEFEDPFKSEDPFAQHDPFASSDPFAAPQEDPFASHADPFASNQFGAAVDPSFPDPFGGAGGGGLVPQGQELKKPPPRPAPPPAKKQAAEEADPFGAALAPPGPAGITASSSEMGVGGGFANFAAFAKFS